MAKKGLLRLVMVGLAFGLIFGVLAGCGASDQNDADSFEGDDLGVVTEIKRLQSLYLPMRDGVRIALDLWLPEGLEPGDEVPTLIRMTRYWRAQGIVEAIGPDGDITKDSNFSTAQQLGEAGYAYVIVDARGTGASFGSRRYEHTADEIRDYGQVADWIAAQPWSNGRVGSFGVSYDGTTAENIAINQSPAVRAIAPLYPDWNAFDHLLYPGNVFLNFFTDDWGHAVGRMDANDICGLQGIEDEEQCKATRTQVTGVKPVDEDTDGSLLAAAIAEHAGNVAVGEAAREIEFRDDSFGGVVGPVDRLSMPAHHAEELEGSGAAIFSRVGWLDAATANGALSRFNTLDNPQQVIIGALSHGGGFDTDPFAPIEEPPVPSRDEQTAERLAFFDRHLKDGSRSRSGEPAKSIRFFTMGAREWQETTVWPPEGYASRTYYLADGGVLSTETTSAVDGSDTYTVDRTATSGRTTRWHTNMGGGDVIYGDRAEQGEKLLTYTTEPLENALEVTGHPMVTLFVSSSLDDAAVFVYLEDVAPDGQVTYVTEGQLRAQSRKVADVEPPYWHPGPYRTFERADAQPLVPGEVVELTFDLWATSVVFDAGHRIRIAIPGADDGNFAHYPYGGDEAPVLSVERNRRLPSRIVLPVKER